MKHIPDRIRREAPNVDRWSIFFSFVILALAVFVIEWKNGPAAIAIVTAVSASAAIFQIRRPDGVKAIVRQEFSPNEDTDLMDFGLRNYGPGAALYLQVEVVTKDSEDALFKIEPRQHPVHLEEGEFLGFLHDDRVSDDRLAQRIAGDEVEEKMVHLYYRYVSPSGARTPEALRGDAKRDDKARFKKLQKECQKPRRAPSS